MSDLTKTPAGVNFPSSASFRTSGLIAALAFITCLFAAGSSASAATYTVTTTADSGAGSLRAAIASANGTSDPDTINFAIPAGDPNCPAGVCTITLTSSELIVNDAATAGTLLITNSTGASNLLVSGNNASRVFYLNSGANLTINGVTITKGNGVGAASSGYGGGIFNNGSALTLINSIVSGNSARYGGGIYGYSDSTTTITNSTVSGNSASIYGGGILNTGTTTLSNSTVSGNSAHNGGGGIYNNSTLLITNSTVSGNTSDSYGGGILNTGTTTLSNSTVSGNMGTYDGGIYSEGTLNLTSVTVTKNNSTSSTCTDCAGGIYNSGGTANLKNTIVAANTSANAFAASDFGGAVATGSAYNLISSGTGMSGISNNDADHNQVGVDARLDPTLQLNGGTTANHALLYGSPALDKGNDTSSGTDQRGFTRPTDLPDATYPNSGNGADIGAYEAQTAPAAPTAATATISGHVTTSSGRGIRGIILSLTDSSGQVRKATTTSFGYYQFEAVQTGETYILSANAKHYTFSQPLQVLNVNEETNQIDFIANSEKRERVF